MSKQFYVVPHTHWDREWYFTIEESRSLLRHDLEEVLTHLEDHPEFTYYVLDGQSVMIEDYLLTRPQDEKRLRALVEAGRLKVGPWFTQTDSQVVGAESMVRNLTYGLQIARRCGEPMMMGYIPDSFGQSASLPHLLNGFGIGTALFWRGRSERHTRDVNFLWRGADGSQVQASNIQVGYGWFLGGLHTGGGVEALEERVRSTLARYEPLASANVILPAGQDQMPIPKDLPDLLAELERRSAGDSYRIATIEEYFADTFSADASSADTSSADTLADGAFEVYEGEFIDPKYMRVHRSIYSTRMDIKLLNARCEAGLTRMLEPLLSVGSLLGFDYSPSLVAEAWKVILQCHAHDSMGGCNSDRVNADIKHRFGKADEVIQAHAELTLRLMGNSIAKADDEDLLLVLNPTPQPQTRLLRQELFVDSADFALLDGGGAQVPYSVVELEDWDASRLDRQLSDQDLSVPIHRAVITFEVPSTGLGYTSYRIVPGRPGALTPVQRSSEATVGNDVLSVEVTDSGINLSHADGQSVRIVLEESGDEGDNYDYSPPPDDLVLADFTFVPGEVTTAHGVRWVTFTAERDVPASLAERAGRTTSVPARFTGHVELRDCEQMARIRLHHTNAADNHRIRLKVVTGVHPEHSVADNQFGVIRRELAHPEAADFQVLGWSERPDPIYPMQGFCAITDDQSGVFVATKGLREYEVTGDQFDALAVTLFRSVGDIGRPYLTRRPGRASGIKQASPDSQLHQELEFDLAVGFLAGEDDILRASQAAQRMNTPAGTYQVKKYIDFRLNPTDREIPAEFTWFTLDDSVVLSTVKLTESQAGYALRFFNPTWGAATVATPALDGFVAHVSRLDEQVGEPAGPSLTVPPCGSATVVYLPAP